MCKKAITFPLSANQLFLTPSPVIFGINDFFTFSLLCSAGALDIISHLESIRSTHDTVQGLSHDTLLIGIMSLVRTLRNQSALAWIALMYMTTLILHPNSMIIASVLCWMMPKDCLPRVKALHVHQSFYSSSITSFS